MWCIDGLVLTLYGWRQKLYCNTQCEYMHFNKGRQQVLALVLKHRQPVMHAKHIHHYTTQMNSN